MYLLAQNDEIDRAIRSLRETNVKISIMTAGAKGGLEEALWVVAGASTNVLGSHFGYHRGDTTRQLGGHTPNSFVTGLTAERMAAHAYWNGKEILEVEGCFDARVIGVGMSATVASNKRPRAGERVHISIFTPERVVSRFHEFKQEETATSDDLNALRRMQGQTCDLMTLNAILDFLGIPTVVSQKDGIAKEIPADREPAFYMYMSMMSMVDSEPRFPYGFVEWNGVEPPTVSANAGRYDWKHLEELQEEVFLLPGSFSPLHNGHIRLLRLLEQQLGRIGVFELSANHPNKGPVPIDVLHERVNQFRAFAPVVVNEHSGLYIQKARLHPGIPMVMGADAAMELLDLRHYGGYRGLHSALEELMDLKTVLYVNGRVVEHMGEYVTMSQLSIPPRFSSLFRDSGLRIDLSSSQIRQAQARNK